jgi:hypothetical protein
LEATFNLELGEHSPFGVVRNGPAKEKTFRKMAFVISLEHVLFCNISEDRDRLVKYNVDLGVGFLLWRVNCTGTRIPCCKLTPRRPRLRLSSINKEINSEDLSLRLMKDSKAFIGFSLVGTISRL